MKTAMSIEWHEKCINNQIEYCKRKKEKLSQLKEEIKRLEEDIEKYAHQIIRAKQLKKSSFDCDRFET